MVNIVTAAAAAAGPAAGLPTLRPARKIPAHAPRARARKAPVIPDRAAKEAVVAVAAAAVAAVAPDPKARVAPPATPGRRNPPAKPGSQ